MSYNHDHASELTIRRSRTSDAPAVRRVAARDSAAVPSEPLLVAAVGGEIRAAMSLADGAVVADPFYPSADLVAVLRVYAGQAVRAARSPTARTLTFERPRRARLAFRSAE